VDRQDRRFRILRAAAALFLERGYAGVSMADVQAAVGGSKSTLYQHFADKADLFGSAVAMLIDDWSGPLRAFRPDPADIAGTLTDFGRDLADIVLAPDAIALQRLVTAEAERVDGIGRLFVEYGPDRAHALLADYLRSLCDAGALNLGDPMSAAAQLCHAMTFGAQLRLLLRAGPCTFDEVEAGISQAVATFLHGALPRAASVPCSGPASTTEN
jgi:TetR/AcrR family transcriptional regulator, mexJK operon transcriptional repressor